MNNLSIKLNSHINKGQIISLVFRVSCQYKLIENKRFYNSLHDTLPFQMKFNTKSYNSLKLHMLNLRRQSLLPQKNYLSLGSCNHNNVNTSADDTHFGFTTVSKEEKAKKVHDVFENVAEKYDLMNDLMSGGIHRLWKDCFVAKLAPTSSIKSLDVAGGTGDITFRIIQYIHNQTKFEENKFDMPIQSDLTQYEEDLYSTKDNTENKEKCEYKMTVCDISENMLEVGRQKALTHGYPNIDWVCGDAQKLPFPDETFDAYTIAYGMRNVVNVEKALQEAYRVLKPGGRFLCLEFSHVSNSLLRSLYDAYSFQMIPVMGQIVAADWDSYQYLVESIRKFPNQETYKHMIEEAGFRKVQYENLTFGVTAIHSGFKI